MLELARLPLLVMQNSANGADDGARAVCSCAGAVDDAGDADGANGAGVVCFGVVCCGGFVVVVRCCMSCARMTRTNREV